MAGTATVELLCAARGIRLNLIDSSWAAANTINQKTQPRKVIQNAGT